MSGPPPEQGDGGSEWGDLGVDDGLDLTPRDVAVADEVRRERRRGTTTRLALLGVAVVAVAGFLLVQFVGSASLFFLNADEAVAQQDDLGTSRFRLQGLVGDEPVTGGGVVAFPVVFNDVSVPVRHTGDPPELFQRGIPVVLEGQWDDTGRWFESSEMIVKHTNEYEADYGDRLDRADEGGER